MDMISEQIKELRDHGQIHKHNSKYTVDLLNKAADTIETLSTKLQMANSEYPKGNYSIGDLSELIEKFDNEKIKGLTDFESIQIFNALKYLDMYQQVGTIEKFMELKQNMEQSKRCYGIGWTPCSYKLPNEKGKYWITYFLGDKEYVEISNFDNGKFDFAVSVKIDVVAWMPCIFPKPYKL